MTSTTIRCTLKAAVDHYPQLAAYRVTLTPDNEPAEAVSRFLQGVQQEIDTLAIQRQGQRQAIQPTQLYALWSLDAQYNIRMLLMLNRNAFGSGGELVGCFMRAFRIHTISSSIDKHPAIELDRSNTKTFSAQLTELRNCAMQLPSPVYTIRTH